MTAKTLTMSACAAAMMAMAPAQATQEAVNFIWIVADDLGYSDVGFHGAEDVLTPQMDRLAADGVIMSTAYVSAPVCGPSRAGFHTGKYQHRFGHEILVSDSGMGTPLDELMIQEHLLTLDYQTGLIGKFHDGKAEKYQPHNRGYAETFAFNSGASAYWVGDNSKGMLKRNGVPVEREDRYLTDAMGQEAVDFITRNADKPFFLQVAFTAPHAPMQATEEKLKEYEHIKGKRQILAAMISSMDDNIGLILDSLEEQGLADNTMVVLFSDNGGKFQHGGENGPLRGQKGSTFEGALRVPFVAKLPGVIPAGSQSDVMISALDLFPTTVKLAGGELDPTWELDGKDILPVLSGDSDVSPHERLFWRFNQHWALREGDWKLMKSGRPSDPMMLFNIAEDIGEENDLVRQFPERAQEMRKTWNEISSEVGGAAWGRYKGEVERK
ncbi:sulfatase-like hydrolase/transferase [Ferrimonas pelagia]|uniref:Sulfatase N-terminal domain-containing protein n=1 Tax=Ferrimonas pelagia TaxID=1177826 RepID=A0ABP9EZC1_9GAMM